MKRLSLLLAAGFLASCVDVSSLAGFECDGGNCRWVDAGGATGGGDGTGGGAQGGGSATGGGGGQVCNASSCTGCCDANGLCRGGSENSACGPAGSQCIDCGDDARCEATICQPLKVNGDACTSSSDCESRSCVTGFCCNSACTGACETCSASGTEGMCSALAEATDVTACGAYACDGISSVCPTSCTTNRQCATGNYCANGTCQPLKEKGAACTASVQCATNFCADGVCCDGACSGSCDRCNLSGSEGTCNPAPSGDPGAPACGTVTCNGTLVDCPILCSSGCPANTFCSGTYCSATKDDGVACSTAGQCKSGFCADGVCCNSACGGSCDACSAAQGASADGVCTLLGASRVCRTAASGGCDREERCTGTSPDCPSNTFIDAGSSCGTTTFGAWSNCDAGMSCATTGVQTRSRTDFACNGMNATCTPGASTESQACNRPSDGASCGSATFGSWSACNYASTCATTATRTRVRTDPVCSSGTCSAVQTNETEACNRTTENVSCGDPSFGTWSACNFGSTCAETGTRTRPRTDPVCLSAACGTTTGTDSESCSRSTGGTSCNTTTHGAWSACNYASPCATTGSRTRTVTTYACGSGTCNPSTTTETETAPCDRSTQGNSCGNTEFGNWSACSYPSTCSNGGSRSRTVTTFTCNAGTCQSSPSTEDGSAACARNTAGTVCREAAGDCDVAETCNAGACPADLFANGVMCDPGDFTFCIDPGYCNGASPHCPGGTYRCTGINQQCCNGSCQRQGPIHEVCIIE